MFRQKDEAWLEYRHPNGRWEVLVEAHDLIALLDELRMRRKSRTRAGGQFKMSPVTRKLIAMKVGDVIEVPPMTQGALTTCRQTARAHLNKPEAVWRGTTLETGHIRIERVADGSPLHRDYRNPAVIELASLEVAGVVILKTLRGKMHNAIKVQARKLMDNPTANWRCENLANGDVRARRTR